MRDAPRLIDRLGPEDAEHFADVRALLDDAGLDYEVDPTLVRGLDYYTRTVFEVESGRLGAQNAIGGGGRYDRLVEQLGGPSTPGWASPPEWSESCSPRATPRSGGEAGVRGRGRARGGAARLRSRAPAADDGRRVELEQAGRSMKGQLKQADRIGAGVTVIVGAGLEVRDMATGVQTPAADAGSGPARGRGAGPVSDAAPNPYRSRWAGELRAGDVGERVRVAGWVHRRRDHGGLIFIDLRDAQRIAPARVPAGGRARGARRGRRAALRGRDLRRGKLDRARGGHREPGASHRRGGAGRGGLDVLADAETPPFPIDEDEPGGRGAPAPLPLPGPAPGGDAPQPAPAPRRGAHDPGAAERRGLPGGGDADPHPVHAGGSARLPGAEPPELRDRGTRFRSPRSCSSSAW